MNPLHGLFEEIVDNMWVNQPHVTAQCDKWRKEREEELALKLQAPARKS